MKPSADHPAPSARQLRYVKALAERSGSTFAYPRTRSQASAEIDRLRRLGRCREPIPLSRAQEQALRYATAPRPDEITGYGSSSHWRNTPPSSSEDASLPEPEDPFDADERQRGARRLGRYAASRGGEQRELVSVAGARGSTLVLDRRASDLGDTRLVAHLSADEAPENGEIVCRMYLDDPTRGRCRRLRAEDLEDDPAATSSSDDHADGPVRDAEGRLYCIREVSCNGSLPELRWTRARKGGEAFDALTLRDVIGALEHYEPARGITLAALRRHGEDDRVSTCRLRGELERVSQSAIVLNRGLREALERQVSSGEVTMSEVARRCGYVKQDSCGDTSWLARRVGLRPEGGDDTPTVWVHSDVLARIARDGLGISPNQVELG